MRAKICGITNTTDALAAVNFSAWAIGFVFYEKSPLCITIRRAREIVSALPRGTLTVGVFVDSEPNVMVKSFDFLGLAQVYSDVKVADDYKNRMIFGLQASCAEDLPKESVLADYGYVLLDAPRASDGKYGGTGRLANWNLARELAKNHRLILAGGLNPSNVAEAIDCVRPFAVDVSSGVAKRTREKDHSRMEQFLMECGREK
ncbi:MAG: phosphoribosylanthranilate isomerase [Puniceicoccales bacterium]|jgi:phosphoribosylanthranilate isomerase|nr:phosphoribosylanthranilate isomerase [Puniceicoccales bacterium]